MVQQSFDQISSFLETLFFHLSARFYGHLILTMPIIINEILPEIHMLEKCGLLVDYLKDVLRHRQTNLGITVAYLALFTV